MGWETPAGSGALGRSGPGVLLPRERTSRSRSCGRSSPGTRTPSAPCAARYAPRPPSPMPRSPGLTCSRRRSRPLPSPTAWRRQKPPRLPPRLAPRPTRLPARLPTRLPTPGPSARGCSRTSSPASHCPKSSRSPVPSLNPRCGRSAPGWPRPLPRFTRQAGSTATSSQTTSGWTERAAPASWTSVTPSARARRRRPSARPALSRLSAHAAPLQPRQRTPSPSARSSSRSPWAPRPVVSLPTSSAFDRAGSLRPRTWSRGCPRCSTRSCSRPLRRDPRTARPARPSPACSRTARPRPGGGPASRRGPATGRRGPPGLAVTTSHSQAAGWSSTCSLERGVRPAMVAPWRSCAGSAAWASPGW